MSNKDDYYGNVFKIYSSPSYKAILELQKVTQSYRQISDMTSEILKQYNAITVPIQKMAKQMTDIISPTFLKSFTNENYQQQLLTMQNSLSFLASNIGTMNIHRNYVSVPESLIPDDFLYEEVIDDSEDSSDEVAKATVPIKRLSFTDTLAIITFLIQVLFSAITFIQSNQDSLQEQKNYDEQIAIETEGNRIQEERNQILQKQVEAIERQAEYLMAIYNKVEEAGSVSPKLDLTFSDTGSDPLSPASPSQCAELGHSVKADEPGDSDTLRKAD